MQNKSLVSKLNLQPHISSRSKPGKVTIPFHGGDIPKGTENSILKQAGLK